MIGSHWNNWRCRQIATTIAVAVLLLATPSAAVEGHPFDVDKRFTSARELAFAGDWDTASVMALEILEVAPEYTDVSVFLARLHAWRQRYGDARERLHRVLEDELFHHDARMALIDVELWSGNRAKALALCDVALQLNPLDEEAVNRRFLILDAMDAIDATKPVPSAPATVPDLPLPARAVEVPAHAAVGEQTEPDTPAALPSEGGIEGAALLASSGGVFEVESPFEIERQLEAERERTDDQRAASYRTSVDYVYTTFDQDFDDWHQVSVALERRSERVTIIGRTSFFNRFHEGAALFELDAYPKLRPGTYAYLSGGVSTDDVVARYRLAAEIYQALPWKTEVSLGWRQVKFDSVSNVLTGTLAVYFDRYWLMARPMLTFMSDKQEPAISVKLRRYYGDEEEYVTLSGGTGKSLEEATATQRLFSLQTHFATLELRKRLIAGYVGKLALGWEMQELEHRSDRNQINIGIGFDYIF